MTFTIIAATALIVLALVFCLSARAGVRSGDGSSTTPRTDCGTCAGNNSTCAQECMMEAAVKPVEYYDDEELDAYAGMSPDSYTSDDIEKFAYVLHTMRQDDVAGWCRSLTLRGIPLPDELRDEAIMMINDEHP